MIDTSIVIFGPDDKTSATTEFTVIKGQYGYLCYHEWSEGGIDFYITDLEFNEHDGGIMEYDEDYDFYTIQELFDFVRCEFDLLTHFDENDTIETDYESNPLWERNFCLA